MILFTEVLSTYARVDPSEPFQDKALLVITFYLSQVVVEFSNGQKET
jgi:hypothetical protein